MKWLVDDATLEWLKVRHAGCGRVYFVLWTADPALIGAGVVPVIPADPAESEALGVPLETEELPGMAGLRTVSPAIRDTELAATWLRHRKTFEESGILDLVSSGF